MAQYVYYNEGEYRYRTDPDTGLRTRFGQRGGKWVTDSEVNATGFAGTEDVDWTTVEANDYTITGRAREGVRDDYYVVDGESQVGGFALAEGVGWDNINGAY